MSTSFNPIPPGVLDRIAGAAEQLRRELPAALLAEEYRERCLRALPAWDEVNSGEDIHRGLRPLQNEITGKFGEAALPGFSRCLIASLALTLRERLPGRRIPPSILELYPRALERLATELADAATANYFGGNDSFLKDLRFAAGLAVPIGPMVVDLRSCMTVASLLKCMTRRESASGALGLLLGRRWTPWFQQHVDSRYVDEINAEGTDRSYRRVADLLELHPEVRGLLGTSWFYDPVIATISPRLAFFSQPFARGAILLRHGPGEIHTARATQTSPTRRRLVEEGKYTPICYSMAWPRESLIRWARQGA